MDDIENIIFDIAEALRVPVLVLALLALAAVLLELGAFVAELLRRRRRDFNRLQTAATEARSALDRGDEMGAKSALRPVAWSTQMARTLAFMVDQWGKSQFGDRLAKGLADFDFRSLRRLERTRLLVRAGPALGLMGTLIPLSPALEGLANGDVNELSDNLRVAFSVTVLGLLIGAIAFGISLVRDRIYGQDLSDLEFVMATLAPELEQGSVPLRSAATDSRVGTVANAAAAEAASAPAAGQKPDGDGDGAAPPRESQAAIDKPPPPAQAKPLGAVLPPPGTGVRPDPLPTAPVSASGAPATAEERGPGDAASPAAPEARPAEESAPTAPPVPGPPPPVSDSPHPAPVPPMPPSPFPSGDPARDATRQQAMPPQPGPPTAPAVPEPPQSTDEEPTRYPPPPSSANSHPQAPERTTDEETW